jgi:outer membrane protein OmpA-like peptidoglycan-associated protein
MKKLLAVLMLIATASTAQMENQPLKAVSVEELLIILAPENHPKTRSLRNLVLTQRSVSLVINFDLESAKIKETSKPLLDNLAVAMQSDLLMSTFFKVEGHTDAIGVQSYNLKLSRNRANSVVSYLVQQGVDKERLISEGKGSTDLLLPAFPNSAENRRVKISTVP